MTVPQLDIAFGFHELDQIIGILAHDFPVSFGPGAFGKAETIIKKITISGLKNQGDCVVTPSAGEAVQTGKSAAAVKWTFAESPSTATFSQSIEYDFAEYDGTLFPEGTLDPAAKEKNLNVNDGSYTFWFIPQNVENVNITIVFDVSLKTLDKSLCLTRSAFMQI